MSARNEIRRQLGNMPTGQYRLSGQEFIVRRVESPVEPQPQTFEWRGIVVCLPDADMGISISDPFKGGA